MALIDLLLHLPPDVERGLAKGLYERCGSVIRETESKRIVQWLLEAGEAPVRTAREGLRAVELVHVGASLFFDAQASLRLARIEDSIRRVAADVTELLELSHEERSAAARAAVEDVAHRLRRGDEFSHDLLRDLRKAELQGQSLLLRLPTRLNKILAYDAGVLGLLKAFTVVPMLTAEVRAHRAAGLLGVFAANVFQDYCAAAFARGIVLSEIAPEELTVWEGAIRQVAESVAGTLCRAAQPHQVTWAPSWGVASLVAVAESLPNSYHRCCDESHVLPIQTGLLLAAELLDIVQTDELSAEVSRVRDRQRWRSDTQRGRAWFELECEPARRHLVLDALRRLPRSDVAASVRSTLYGHPAVVVALEGRSGLQLIAHQLRQEGLPAEIAQSAKELL